MSETINAILADRNIIRAFNDAQIEVIRDVLTRHAFAPTGQPLISGADSALISTITSSDKAALDPAAPTADGPTVASAYGTSWRALPQTGTPKAAIPEIPATRIEAPGAVASSPPDKATTMKATAQSATLESVAPAATMTVNAPAAPANPASAPVVPTHTGIAATAGATPVGMTPLIATPPIAAPQSAVPPRATPPSDHPAVPSNPEAPAQSAASTRLLDGPSTHAPAFVDKSSTDASAFKSSTDAPLFLAKSPTDAPAEPLNTDVSRHSHRSGRLDVDAGHRFGSRVDGIRTLPRNRC